MIPWRKFKRKTKMTEQQIRVCLEIHKLNLTCSNFAVIWPELLFGQKPNRFCLRFSLNQQITYRRYSKIFAIWITQPEITETKFIQAHCSFHATCYSPMLIITQFHPRVTSWFHEGLLRVFVARPLETRCADQTLLAVITRSFPRNAWRAVSWAWGG